MPARFVYRLLLRLYPGEFREQFSEEMLSVFEQRAGERFAKGRVASIALCISEFAGILKGACTMWTTGVVPNPSSVCTPLTDESALSVEQLEAQRSEAVRKMVAAIADHEFGNAQRYSEEEIRLRSLLNQAPGQVPAGRIRTA